MKLNCINWCQWAIRKRASIGSGYRPIAGKCNKRPSRNVIINQCINSREKAKRNETMEKPWNEKRMKNEWTTNQIGALSYAELGTMITQSGAEYAYFRHAFGPLPAFIFCWVCTLVLKPSQLAIICLAFAKYTVEAFVTECEPPVFIVQLLCAAVIGTFSLCIVWVWVFGLKLVFFRLIRPASA